MTEPILTVFLLTYNHEKTIRDTFRGILQQKTLYPFVVKILEDCSTDSTLKICQEYVREYPDLFQLIAQPKNTKGFHIRIALENEIKTPYFTFIEGDDYWINENHLQKAISFLESHRDYNLYASNVWHWSELSKVDSFECQNLDCRQVGHNISFENYIYLQTSGRVYRSVFDFKKMPKNTVEKDIFMYYLYLDKGKSFCDHEIDSIYRISTNGLWNRLSPKEQSNAFFNVVYTAAKLLNYRHATFLIEQLPLECRIKKLQSFIGSRLTLRLFAFCQGIKMKFTQNRM